MPDQTPLVRQWLLLKMLGSHRNGVTLDEMAAETRVNKKTIRRDLLAFSEVGFPLEQQTGAYGRKTWKLALANNSPDLHFAFDEALALYLARHFLEPLAGTFLWQAAQNAFGKIRACLGRNALKYLEQMTGHLHATTLGKSNYAEKAALIDTLLQAIEERKVVLLTYQSLKATEPVEYELAPYGVAYHKGSLYLIAHSRDHEEVRHFKVDRIEQVELTDFPFRMPEKFNVADHLANSFGIFQGKGDLQVKVRFLPAAARYAQEGTWHTSQKLVKQKDGSVLATFQLSSIEEIKRWLLTFGRQVVVQEPAQLREALRIEAREILNHYAADSFTEDMNGEPTITAGKQRITPKPRKKIARK
jgi:proteasome accessory factor B